jgi:hypothetical protein
MSSWIGSFAWDFGAATNISDFTEWEFTTENPAPNTALANASQPVSL